MNAREKRLQPLAVLALVLMASVAEATTLQGTFERTFDVKPGTMFSLDNTNGRIALRSWDSPRVQIRAVKKVESRDAGEARKAFDALLIVPTQSADRLRIETKTPQRNDGLFDWIAGTNVNVTVDFDITVPRSMSLEIDNTNGAIDITGVSGSMRISNTNGHIECAQCGGDIDAETTNGPIRAELAEVNRAKPIRLESTNGRVTIVVPRSLAARIDAETTNGSIESDLPVSVVGHQERTSLRGTLNGGGADLKLRTTNGSISIQSH